MEVPNSALVVGINCFVGDSLVKGLSNSGSFVYGIESKDIGCNAVTDLVKIIKAYNLEKIYLVNCNDLRSEKQFSVSEIEEVAQLSGIPYVCINTVSGC